jgi:hypothetical protein
MPVMTLASTANSDLPMTPKPRAFTGSVGRFGCADYYRQRRGVIPFCGGGCFSDRVSHSCLGVSRKLHTRD